MSVPCIVLDNGADTAKVEYNSSNEPRVIPNFVIKAKTVRNRIFVGDQIDECKDLSGLYYLLAFQKGYLVNWDVEKQVWDHIFGKDCFKVNFDETGIVVTEPYFNFTSIRDATYEILFEDYQFAQVYSCNPAYLSQLKRHSESARNNKTPQCSIFVDSGYSFTHVVPYFNGHKIKEAVCRIDVGGKVLTNHLKEILSYRQLMVMDETYVINQLKEDLCFVSTQFTQDMDIARKKAPENTIMRDYVLPDYTHIKRGYVKTTDETSGSEQLIRMNNERFSVPEILFRPSDVGIHQMGVAEAVSHVVSKLPKELRSSFCQNIVLTGGNCRLPNFHERFCSDLRSLLDEDIDMDVHLPKNPVTNAWEGSKILCQRPDFAQMAVTQQEYEEYGTAVCHKKFDI